MRSHRAIPDSRQEPYARMRDNPYFNGLLRGDDAILNPAPTSDLQGSGGTGRRRILRATSDIGDIRHRKVVSESPAKIMDSTLEDSISDLVLEPFARSSSVRSSKLVKTSSSALPIFQSGSSFGMDHSYDILESSNRTVEANEERSPGLGRPTIQKSYSVTKRKADLLTIPLPQCAASFYGGYSQESEIVESCESINRLNHFLKSRRDDLNAGVPGRFLHAVMGQDASDVGTVASVIMYAFYLHETLKNDQLCTVPVINMKRANLSSHAELKWLLDSCQIDQSSLIFIDEIDLSYYDLFGSLKLVLLNGRELPTKQEALKDAVVEIFNCRKVDVAYPWVETVTIGQDCSCCTLVAEKFTITSPEILAGQGFSRLLLAGILLDTANLTDPHCTSKDKYMATLLINSAGRFGLNGLYHILRYKMYDVSELKVIDILAKDFKKWTRVGKPGAAGSRVMVSHIGMSSIGISVRQLLSHEDASTREIKYFQQTEKLRLLMIVSGYYDMQKNFKREILVSGESADLMKNLLYFFNSNASQLPLKVIHQPGLRDEMKAFEIDKVTSRKTIEHLLEEFGGISKARVNNMGS